MRTCPPRVPDLSVRPGRQRGAVARGGRRSGRSRSARRSPDLWRIWMGHAAPRPARAPGSETCIPPGQFPPPPVEGRLLDVVTAASCPDGQPAAGMTPHHPSPEQFLSVISSPTLCHARLPSSGTHLRRLPCAIEDGVDRTLTVVAIQEIPRASRLSASCSSPFGLSGASRIRFSNQSGYSTAVSRNSIWGRESREPWDRVSTLRAHS
jgi:hypothetical protein